MEHVIFWLFVVFMVVSCVCMFADSNNKILKMVSIILLLGVVWLARVAVI